MFLLSLPMRERGLKFLLQTILCKVDMVAPHAGAWIEIVIGDDKHAGVSSRSPCGSVD